MEAEAEAAKFLEKISGSGSGSGEKNLEAEAEAFFEKNFKWKRKRKRIFFEKKFGSGSRSVFNINCFQNTAQWVWILNSRIALLF